ncbi:cyclase-associated protein, putative [Plasmodium gallinaceum]|uniref:Cyclase-associated protein, putative n=1 Tax=Plasmodium gallinaceum TaxID=5849 RepID=A0A1J1GLT6_PLAGA|nr:cyclase-associated protein, putative [Plasmodium gallinaceum]CRG93308.1 cyclase-associated protein, putative [Plasmodium gallinaceum]
MAIFSCCTEVQLAKDNYHIKKFNEKKLNNDNKIKKEKLNNNDIKKKINNEKERKIDDKVKDKTSNNSKNNKFKQKKSEFKNKKRNFPKNQENMTSESVLELKDNQWNVSNFKNSGTVKLNEVELNNAVNIFNSENTTFVIENDKFKSLQIQKCVKCNIVLNNLISSIEIIDSKKIKVQALGKCSSITIDKCVGVDIYLSKENTETEFTTALSAEMNIHLENEDNDWNEITIPEQFQHQLENGKLNTRVSDLYKY